MKTIILVIALIGTLLFTGIAVGLLSNVGTITATTNTRNIINSINNETLQVGEIWSDDNYYYQKAWKGEYNLGEAKVSKKICSSYQAGTNVCLLWTEIKPTKAQEELLKQFEKQLEELAKIIQKRQQVTNKTKISDGGLISYA